MAAVFHDFASYAFPNQRVSNAEKEKPEWYANCCDYVISAGLAAAPDREELEKMYRMLANDIPDEFYAKILNPYNATNEKYKRFPATMRNYDIISGVIRRYVSEYIKNPHDFIVGANNPDVVMARDAQIKQEMLRLAEAQIAAKISESYQRFINEGNDPQQFNPQEAIDINAEIEKFKQEYVDKTSAQGQELLNVIDDITESLVLYSQAYFDFVAFGECYTYSDVVGNKLIKRVVSPRDVFPVPNDSQFVEDYDMFAERMKMTYQQIVDSFDEYLSEKDRKFLETYYARHSANDATPLSYQMYASYYGDVCSKFTAQEREAFESNSIMARDNNTGLYDVWHVVWRGEVRRAIVTYAANGFLAQRVVNDDYVLNPEIGDVSIEYIYEPQVYESVRIGGRNNAIYPYKARAIAYNRKGKLPYNGLVELIKGFGPFSIVKTMTPYQVFMNIVYYHREMAIAKNKLSVLLVCKSLLGSSKEDVEDAIYKMAADGVLYIDDSDDQNMLKAQQIRMLNASIGDYITQLTNLITEIENTAKDRVDMTPQRYGQIANSAGKGVTEEAIMRGSMGSVIIEFMFDAMRERDCARDLDFTKLAWIDGLNTSYRDADNNIKYISLDVNNHVYADYIIKAKNSIKEKEKLDQIKQFAFSAAQNGDMNMAIASIAGDNVSAVKNLIMKFQAEKQQHEEALKSMDQQLAQMEQEFELQKIAAKGEEDRKTLEVKNYLDQQIELIRADANMISYNADVPEAEKTAGLARLEEARAQVERDKVQVEREKSYIDAASKAADRAVKMHDIDTKLKIAKENKNKYDFKGKKSTKK